MNEHCELAHLALQRASITYAVTDHTLHIVAATHETWQGQFITSVFPVLVGMEATLHSLALGHIAPFSLPYVEMPNNPWTQERYLSYYLSSYPQTKGIFVVIRGDTEMATVLQEVSQQHNELALLREALEARTLELEEANRALRALDQERHFLISMINHDIRAPLAVVANNMALLLRTFDSDLDERQRALVELAMEAAQSARELADMVLQIERIHRAQDALRANDLDLNALLREVLQRYSSLAENKGVLLESEFLSLPPIRGDWHLLREAFANIVENGIKYTPSGGRVKVRTWYEEDHCFVEVRDSGIGIASQDLPHLFEPFKRGRSNRERGTGLGLYIAHKVITLHAGEMWVRSEPGKGSRIFVRLPQRPPHT